MIRTLLLMTMILSTGCSVWKPVPYGEIRTPNIVISAVDRSFTLRSDVEFKTPFHLNCGCLGSGVMPESYSNYLSAGAKPVRVKNPYTKDPLYGVIAFCNLEHSDPNLRQDVRTVPIGPGTRSHEIVIPRNYIDQARGRRISVVYEVVPDNKNKCEHLGWILWLSDRKLVM